MANIRQLRLLAHLAIEIQYSMLRTQALPTIFLYTQEQRGNQFVESEVIGMLSDVSGSQKFIVLRDPYSQILYAYRIEHTTNNLDASAVIQRNIAEFDGKHSITITAMTYRLGTPDNAIKLLRGKSHWIQDKSAVLSVLLHSVGKSKPGFCSRSILRDRITRVPAGTPFERLGQQRDKGN